MTIIVKLFNKSCREDLNGALTKDLHCPLMEIRWRHRSGLGNKLTGGPNLAPSQWGSATPRLSAVRLSDSLHTKVEMMTGSGCVVKQFLVRGSEPILCCAEQLSSHHQEKLQDLKDN